MERLFESERTYARQLISEDFGGFQDMQSNPNVMRYVGQNAMSVEECKVDLGKLINHYLDPNDGFRVWGVFSKESNDFLGTAAILSTEKGHELGYRFCEKHWGFGYGTEVSKATLIYGFEKLGIEEFFAEVDQLNLGSVHVLDKTMNRIRAFWNEESDTDDYYYTRTKEEHEANRH